MVEDMRMLIAINSDVTKAQAFWWRSWRLSHRGLQSEADP